MGQNRSQILHIFDSWERWPHPGWVKTLADQPENSFLFLEDGPSDPLVPRSYSLKSNIRSLGLSLRSGYKSISEKIVEAKPSAVFCYGKWAQLAALPAAYYSKVDRRWFFDIELADITATQSAALNLVRKNFSNGVFSVKPWESGKPGLILYASEELGSFGNNLSTSQDSQAQVQFIDIVVTNEFLNSSQEVIGALVDELSGESRIRLLIESAPRNSELGKYLMDELPAQNIPGKDQAERSQPVVSSDDRELSEIVVVLDSARLNPDFVIRGFQSQSVMVLPDVSMSRHFVTPGENGWVFPPGDYDRVKEVCQNICGDPALKQGLSKAGWQDALNRWSYEGQWKHLKESL